MDVLSRSRDVLQSGLTLTGPMTSWGVPDPPGSVYLMLPAALMPFPPTAAVVWVGLLNVLAVVLTYLLAERYYGTRVALVAGLLFAVNPWAVYFSRRSWAEIVPLFTVAALWAAYEVVVNRRARWAVLFFVALAVQVQIRILSLIFGPAALLTVALWPWRWGVRWPALGIGIGALLTAPYLGWVALNWGELSGHLAAGNRGVAVAPQHDALELVLWTAAGFGLLPATSDVAAWLDPLGMVGWVVVAVVGVLLAAALVMAVLAVVRRRPGWERTLLPVVWLVLPFGALVLQSSSIYLHYLVALFPAVFLALALPLGWLLERPRLPGVALGAAILLFVMGYQLTATGVVYRVMEAYEVDEPPSAPPTLRFAAVGIPREASELLGTGERYGVEPPIRYWRAIADRAAAEVSAAGGGKLWILAGETDPLTAEVPALLDYLFRPQIVPHFLPADTLMFRMLYPGTVVELPDFDPIESMERFGERRASVPAPSRNNREGLTRARITAVPARGPQGWQAVAPTRLTARFEGIVQLMGYRAEREIQAGDDLAVTLFWWVTSQSPVRPVVSLRLVGDGNQVVRSEQPDRVLPEPVEDGDWVIVRREVFAVPELTPPGQYTLDVALVDERTGQPLRREDEPGGTLPLTTVRVTAP